MFTGLRADIPPVAYVKVSIILTIKISFLHHKETMNEDNDDSLVLRLKHQEIRIDIKGKVRIICYLKTSHVEFSGPGPLDGGLHDVCFRSPWRVCGSESTRQAVPDEQEQGTGESAPDNTRGKYN